MMSDTVAEFSTSTLSLHSNGSQNEDWDRSESDIQADNKPTTTPRNSVIFPVDGNEKTPGRGAAGKGERTLSELLKLHAEKGTEGRFSQDEASRVAEVLGQWVISRRALIVLQPTDHPHSQINSESSPYEAEDDFFTRSQDDSSLLARRSPASPIDPNGRPRGQSESIVGSRPSSATEAIRT